jgi:ribosomal protein L7/L12
MNTDQDRTMKRIVVFGWKLNFDKIGFTKFLRAEFGYSLTKAKDMTDGLLENRSVVFEIAQDQLEHIEYELIKLQADYRAEEVE